MLRLGLLDRLVRNGELYPRWAPDLLLGYGYPLFNFYAPASYYVAEALVLAGISPYYAFIATLSLFVIVAGLGMYALAYAVLGGRRLPALTAAVAYLYSPYLLTNVFIRGAAAEVGAQALLPWILLAARNLYWAGRPQRHALALALLLGLLAVTHTITLLTLPPLLLLYMLAHCYAAGRDRGAIGWSALALVAAMAVSAFFWLPLLAERRYLADTAYEISRTVWLPASLWTWDNFLDAGLRYAHTFARPVRLGIVQALLAGLGFFLARRKDAEWLFYGVSALALALLMGSWALPLWLHIEPLSIIQFGWRLLALLSLPLALFTGALIVPAKSALLRLAIATLVIGITAYSHTPRLEWMDVFAPETVDVSAPVFAQTEIEKGALDAGEGNSSIQEFRPRWADRTLTLDPVTVEAAPDLDVAALRGGDHALSLRVQADAATTLRFATFYFPGWQVSLDGRRVPAYPSTNLGLLTVDLAPGEHLLDVAWTGTRLHLIATILSFITLAALAVFAFRNQLRPIAALLAAGCALALVAWGIPPATEPILPAAQEISLPEMGLLGSRTTQHSPRDLYVTPYWYVRHTPSADLRFVWSLRDSAGKTVAESHAAPFYNAYATSNWPSNAVVDDAVRIRLPDNIPAGEYGLFVEVRGNARDSLASGRAGSVILKPPPALSEPAYVPVTARYGEVARLLGYRYLRPQVDLAADGGRPLTVRAGDVVRLALHWQATAPIDSNYHGFVHLVNHVGLALAGEDQLPGPFFQPPRLWDERTAWPDVYRLHIPQQAESGLYWPSVGLYDFAALDRLPVFSDDSDDAGLPQADYRLPPIKVVAAQRLRPDHALDYEFPGLARLTGYDLEPGAPVVRAGESMTVTLHLRSLEVTSRDLVRFLQLYKPESGVIAQHDGLPQAGNNPTWSWLPGESVVDSVILAIPSEAPPGRYTLYAGFYDPAQNNARLDVTGPDGSPILEQWAALTAVEIASGP